MTPIERLLQEEVPTRPAAASTVHSMWTEQERDRHWADLCAAVGMPNTKRPAPVHTNDTSEAAA
ncbi:hypothetical protein ACFVGN_05690 [Streptomyces sp. NPDC057757]|uniref:hypothetical protein n=1 Tax=Streptomyces sp. NPDC057757 TaxID=3346241 RepID=UPI00368D7019